MSLRGARGAAAIVAMVLAMVLATTSCSSDDETDASRAVQSFAEAMSRQDTQGAAEMTTSPSQAAQSLGVTFAGMHAKELSVDPGRLVEYSDGSASFSLTTTWTWSEKHTFETKTSGSARRLSSGWKVQWDPGLLYTGLTADGRLQEVRTDAKPAPTVRTDSGKPFMQMEPVNEITVNPATTKDLDKTIQALVSAVEKVAPKVTTKSVKAQLDDAQGQEVVAVTLRDSDMSMLDSDPSRIAGVNVHKSGMLVMSDRRLSTPLSSGITNYWNALRDATAGWQVQLVTPGSPPQKLAGHQGGAAPDVNTTIDPAQQLALGAAVVEVAQPATMMALDAKTGGILAMAQNDAAAKRKIDAGTAYPVGDTLDPVFDAIEGAGKAKDKSTVDSTLNSLGLGLDYTVPGLSMPQGAKPKITAAAYRPKDFTASMMSMAALGVALERSVEGKDTAVAPFVIKGAESKVTGGDLGRFDDAVVRQIRDKMAATAKDGDASDITRAPGLRALVGTNGPQGPGWFVGSQGGRVFVVYCEGDRSGTAALQVLQKYFSVR